MIAVMSLLEEIRSTEGEICGYFVYHDLFLSRGAYSRKPIVGQDREIVSSSFALAIIPSTASGLNRIATRS